MSRSKPVIIRARYRFGQLLELVSPRAATAVDADADRTRRCSRMSLDELVGRAQQLVDEDLTPACQLAVARDGQMLAFETFGDATNENRFCAFSATKPIVASVMWMMMDDGLLAPDQLVVEHIPEFGSHGKDVITIEQVMLHTSGFPNALMRPVDGADAERRRTAFTA